MRLWLAILLATCAGCAAPRVLGPPRDYYFSATGDDHADGTAERPFRSIFRANELRLNPGDRLLFQAGQTFQGNILLDELDAGTDSLPVRIASFGPGRATINAGEGTGLLVKNAGGVELSNLVITGAGRDRNLGTGVEFANLTRGGKRLKHVRITDVDVAGFGRAGIYIHSQSFGGFSDVLIDRCAAHDNLHCGISVGGFRVGEGPLSNENVTVRRCAAYWNTGDPFAREDNTSGSGILVAYADGVMVDQCAAWDNGARSRGARGGPMGIWASEANRVVIQSSESHHNRTAGRYDGGGFGFDGGVTNSVLQHNYSHDNDGSGFGLYQYEGAAPWHDNTVRYNISENDGRRNAYAGVHVWDGMIGGIRRAWIYHNTIVMSRGRAGPRGIWLDSPTRQVRVANNIIATDLDVVSVAAEPGQRDVLFMGNCYWTPGGSPTFDWEGVRYTTLDGWRAGARQERGGGTSVDPRFEGSEGVARWRLRADSSLVDSGANLPVDTGGRDFAGTRIPQGQAADVGAFETPAR